MGFGFLRKWSRFRLYAINSSESWFFRSETLKKLGAVHALDFKQHAFAVVANKANKVALESKFINVRTKTHALHKAANANPQALDAIAAGGNFEASVAQDFAGIGAATADAVARQLAGETINQGVIYVPTTLVTAANVGDFLSQ